MNKVLHVFGDKVSSNADIVSGVKQSNGNYARGSQCY